MSLEATTSPYQAALIENQADKLYDTGQYASYHDAYLAAGGVIDEPAPAIETSVIAPPADITPIIGPLAVTEMAVSINMDPKTHILRSHKALSLMGRISMRRSLNETRGGMMAMHSRHGEADGNRRISNAQATANQMETEALEAFAESRGEFVWGGAVSEEARTGWEAFWNRYSGTAGRPARDAYKKDMQNIARQRGVTISKSGK